MKNYKNREQINGFQLDEGEGGREIKYLKHNKMDPCGEENALYLEYLNIEILVVMRTTVMEDILQGKNGLRLGALCTISYNCMNLQLS